MNGKAQRKPALHSVVLDCKLVPLHNTCQRLPAVCLYKVHAVISVSQCKYLGGGWKISPIVLSRFRIISSSNSGACRGLAADWRVFYRLLISCSIAKICSVKVRSRSKKRILPHPALGVNARGRSGQIFQIAGISEYVSKFSWDPFSELRDKASKKRKKKPQR